jgi:hydrogenase maturation protein HypF
MHEMSLLRGLIGQIESIAREHRAGRVTVVRLKLGPLAHIDPAHLREHFVQATRGSVAEPARLEIETTDALHELSLESVDIEPAVPAASSGDGLQRLPAIEAMAARIAGGRARQACAPCLATGGHLKNATAIWTGREAMLGPPIGSMDDARQRAAFITTVAELKTRFDVEPAVIACDLHPDYFTTRWASEQGKPIVRVQHHHAHAVACMVEHELVDREVVAVTWDGTGFGPDNTIWGGEILHARVNGFERVASLEPFPLPGGEAAIRNPNRIAFVAFAEALKLYAADRREDLRERLGLSVREARWLTTMVERSVNTPHTSSVGRLFDAVAALVLGIHQVRHEGEAAMRLEAAADWTVRDSYELPVAPCDSEGGLRRADWRPMLQCILRDVVSVVPAGVIAACFHNALARWAAATVAEFAPRDVVLSGGCFHNRLLTARTVDALQAIDRRAFCHEQLSPGDDSLAVGQLAVAMTAINRM